MLHVSAADLAAARDGFAPAASWGVTRADAGAAAGPRGWDDVGGLPDAVAALREALALPTRFARLCARCALVQGRLLVLRLCGRGWPERCGRGLQLQPQTLFHRRVLWAAPLQLAFAPKATVRWAFCLACSHRVKLHTADCAA